MKKFFVIIIAMLGLNNIAWGQSYRDAIIFDLSYGKVKTCTWIKHQPTDDIISTTFNNKVSFKLDGTAIWPGNDVIRLDHNEVSQICGSNHWNVEWGSKGTRINSIEYADFMLGKTYKYQYDEKKRVKQCVEYWIENTDTPKRIFEYKYVSFDSKGNWNKRECVVHSDSKKTKVIESRTITYY